MANKIYHLDGDCQLSWTCDGEASELQLVRVSDAQRYTGETTVTPSGEIQTLETAGLVVPTDITVNAIPTASCAETEIEAVDDSIAVPEGYHDGTQSIEISETEQAKIISSNIKSGVEILGVSGSSTVVDVSADTVTASTLQQGETAHAADGSVVTGSLVPGITPAGTVSISQNGTVDVTSYASAEVDVNTDPTKGVVFENWDEDGFPTTARIVGFTSVPEYYFWESKLTSLVTTVTLPDTCTTLARYVFYQHSGLETCIIPDSVTSFGDGVFRDTTKFYTLSLGASDFLYWGMYNFSNNINTVIFRNQINAIPYSPYQAWGNSHIQLIDMSNNTSVATLGTSNVTLASGCVIRVPSALLEEWQNETNWIDLTDVVWEGV